MTRDFDLGHLSDCSAKGVDVARRRRWRLIVSHGVAAVLGCAVAAVGISVLVEVASLESADPDASLPPLATGTVVFFVVSAVVAGLATYVFTYIALWQLLSMFSAYVFLSYSRADQKYAHRLRRLLRFSGVKVWMDRKLRTGDEWLQVLHAKIDDSAGVVLIMSPESEQSEWVQHEVARAESQEKPIIPLLLRGEPHPQIKSKYHYIDARRGGRGPNPRRVPGRLHADIARITG